MRKVWLTFALALALTFALCASAAFAQSSNDGGATQSQRKGPPFKPGEIVVQKKGQIDVEVRKNQGNTEKELKDKAKKIEEEPDVVAAGPNYRYDLAQETAADPVSDLLFDQQWWITRIRAPGAWVASQGDGYSVGLVDSGVYQDHPDLVNKIVAQYDFVSEDSIAEDVSHHGTLTAGVAAAETNNGDGIAGTGYNAKIAEAKACTNYCYTEDTAPAINWLVDQKATTNVVAINMSFAGVYESGSTGDPVLNAAIDNAVDNDVVMTAAIGNHGVNSDTIFPACYGESTDRALDKVIGVGALNEDNTLRSTSNTGSCVDLVAPGTDILSTTDPTYDAGQLYASYNGTSFAAPQAAGTVPLVKANNPDFTRGDLQYRILKEPKNLGTSGWDERYGYGLLRAKCAVRPGADGC